MYGSGTEIVVLLRILFGFIWDLSDVFTVHIGFVRAQNYPSKIDNQWEFLILNLDFYWTNMHRKNVWKISNKF